MVRLDNKFFIDTPEIVAPKLLGKQIVVGDKKATIIEVEAYGGQDDAASHAFKKTKRSAIMYDNPGLVYMYLVYGMHCCLNFVVSPNGVAGAILIRSIILDGDVVNGPGRTSKALGLDLSYKGLDITTSTHFAVYDIGYESEFNISERIGISKAKEKMWRFYTPDLYK